MTGRLQGGSDQMARRFWPAYPVTVTVDIPLLPDGTVDVRTLLKQWDETANRGLTGHG